MLQKFSPGLVHYFALFSLYFQLSKLFSILVCTESWLKAVDLPPPPLWFDFLAIFFLFLHHGIDKVERNLVRKPHEKIQRENWSNLPPKLGACYGLEYPHETWHTYSSCSLLTLPKFITIFKKFCTGAKLWFFKVEKQLKCLANCNQDHN